ncbi:NmrA family NAD(P)-binding protein [Rhizobium sp. LCM 4573]|uniref:NmrA family NAD(P)-binding protein n=1 Tax=Rhizobium sp. LCM 4573 TaxID=1848291 RepID=UPI0008D94A00|nr:NmrA family NAD(P)-binding protein [Rhizobium sp. LCM 4573]OHV82743.1 NmrA family transcriptional regulator [Rhizobium sp. LCM 4573]
MQQDRILIIGANGKTGARVNARLKERGIETRAVSRSSEIPFDWERPESWAAAFDGMTRAYVTFQPDLAVEGAAEAIEEICRISQEKELKHLVLLSGRGEPGAQRAEAALQASGIPWTIVRASWFSQNFSESYLLDSVLAGEIALPAGPVPEPFIDVDDIADVVVAALTGDRHMNQLYEVTGPRALTFAQAAGEISQAIGRPVRYRQISPEEFAKSLAPHASQGVIDLLLELFTVVLDGRNTSVMHGVEQALGRPARDFSDYVRRTAASGVWKV